MAKYFKCDECKKDILPDEPRFHMEIMNVSGGRFVDGNKIVYSKDLCDKDAEKLGVIK